MARVTMVKMITAAAAAVLATGVQASAPGEFEKMNTRANRACIAMSGLARPELLANKISFSDTIGTEVRMIRGTDQRGRMQRLLCAYNRKTGRAEVQPGGVWNGPAIRP